MTAQPISLDRLVQRLEGCGDPLLRPDAITELLGESPLVESSLRSYLNFLPEKYCRNGVHRGPWFDMLILCWNTAQATPIHNHSGQSGWVRVLRGTIAETTYGTSLDDPARALDLEIDADGTGSGLEVWETGQSVAPAGAAVLTVDRSRSVHRLANVGGERAVTLHLYSRPHDSCLAFDPEAGTCRRVQLVLDRHVPAPAQGASSSRGKGAP